MISDSDLNTFQDQINIRPKANTHQRDVPYNDQPDPYSSKYAW